MMMIKKILIFFIIAFSLVSCGEKKRLVAPPDVIPADQMVQVLVDAHLMEAALVQASLEGKDVNYLSSLYYYSLMSKYHLTYKKFNKSLDFYSSNPGELYLIYKDVVSELSKTQSRIASKRP